MSLRDVLATVEWYFKHEYDVSAMKVKQSRLVPTFYELLVIE